MSSRRTFAMLCVGAMLAVGCASQEAFDAVPISDAGTASSETTEPPATPTQPPTADAAAAARQGPNLEVLPWNGHRAALSWTFDDGDPSHLGTVVPLLDDEGIPGTFYPTCLAIAGDPGAWREVAAGGVHEIANHTVSHVTADGGDDDAEIANCRDYLAAELNVTAGSFAYPSAVVGDPYRSYSRENYVAARSGWQATSIVGTSRQTDWYDVPSVFIGEGDELTTEERLARPLDAIERANIEAGWLTLTFHSVGTGLGYAPVSLEELQRLIAESREFDFWHATFADVATYHRGRVALLRSEPVADADGWIWEWEAVPGMTAVPVKVRSADGVLSQAGEPLPVDEDGISLVDPRVGSLTWSPAP